MKKIAIAIDGPSGAGKSSIAKALAKSLNIIYVDTGAIYRTVGLYVYRNGVESRDKEKIISMLPDISVKLAYIDGAQHIFLNGEDVSGLIRTETISRYASDVSAIPEVRAFLLSLQRDMAKETSVIMDGRDIGTVVLPDAEVKIFMTASAEVRARRRYKELIEKGESVVYEDVLAAIITRDTNDSTRATAPLKAADDAVILDNSEINAEETLNRVIDIIRSKTQE
ncbi:MAG: (d)CMP kinase [Clostridia bacterium]|nr:(d)CMP kinase [Clostridia bacterium]MBR4954829.1 (d)CMP kinase [Clostridia bacterium]